MPKSRKQREEASAEIVRFTTYIDNSGERVDVVRCEQCKGYGCDACNQWGFLKQGTLALLPPSPPK